MREIKFRALWTDGYCEPKWVYGYLTERDRNILIDPGGEEDDFIIITKHKNSVGQYTGLKDRNGKEIYEGDIIRTHFSFSHEVTQEPFIIQWNKDKAMFEGVKQNPEQDEYLRSFSFFPEQRFIYEVIGNIHENPEMLEV